MKRFSLCVLAAAVVAVCAVPFRALQGGTPPHGGGEALSRTPKIRPDYTDVVIPPNIAPLNFVIEEPGRRWRVRFSGERGGAFEVGARNGVVHIPARRWRSLLAANRGGEIYMEVRGDTEGAGRIRFAPIRNRVAAEEVDRCLVYRLIGPVFNNWSEMGIYQRDLTSFRERPVFRNRETNYGCINCHTFLLNRPDVFLLHTRPEKGGTPGMLLARQGAAVRVDTRTANDRRPAAYPAWHPSGKVIAYSVNKIRQFFHTAGDETRDVTDLDSGLGLYSVEAGTVARPAALNDPDRLETFPNWSPDGRYLYFCSARNPWPKTRAIPHEHVKDARYDLVRASFDLATGRVGKPETLVEAAQTGRSSLEPRVSPDGRFLLFCMCDYGSFPIYQPHTDLYLMDLRDPARPYWRLFQGETSWRDSWHSWSSNGRWIVFSRKHQNPVFARPHLCYIDTTGRAAKPLVVPQADPTFYDRYLKNYNAPELVTAPVAVPERELSRAYNSGEVRQTVEVP
ncbi:MAG: cytochrome C biosynthesis protein [Armatimonadota bacterium]|nr:cytochrome C biosynthesis protein [Armatimonadota bacterium]